MTKSFLKFDEFKDIAAQEQSDALHLCKSPLVTVLMLTHNHENYISEAIEGVISQETDFPFELLIGEDCSDDKTRDICMDYQSRYPEIIRLVTSDENVGMHKNYFRILLKARGEYIAFCEGDDHWIRHDKLKLQIDFLQENPGYGMVYSGYNRYDVVDNSTEVILQDASSIDSESMPWELLFFDNIRIGTCTVCCRTALVRKIHREFPEDFSSCFPMADAQMWFHLSRLAKVGSLDEVLAEYRKRPGSVTSCFDHKKRIESTEKGLEAINYFLKKYSAPSEWELRINAHKARALFILSLNANDTERIEKYYQIWKESNYNWHWILNLIKYVNNKNFKLLLVRLYFFIERKRKKTN